MYTGELPFGIGGKDVILYTMGQLKRNTVAFERAVEYTGNIKEVMIYLLDVSNADMTCSLALMHDLPSPT